MIAGISRTWEYQSAERLAERLDRLPWCSQGAVVSLVVGGINEVENCVADVERRIFALNADRRAPRIALADGGGSIETALRRAFGQARDGAMSTRQLLESGLREAPLVLFVVETEAEAASSRILEAEALVELAAKVVSSAGLLVVVIVADLEARSLEGALDMTVGMPRLQVLAMTGRGNPGMWDAYLRVRAAYESGGSLSRVSVIDAELRGAGIGDDEAVEAGLARAAKTLATKAGGDGELMAYERERLAEASEGRSRALVDGRFERAGISWTPPNALVSRPSPWAARRLLSLQPSSKLRSSLRAALVCAPLVGELLAAVLQLETLVYDRWAREIESRIVLNGQDDKAWQRYKRGDNRLCYYPKGHPAPPREPSDAVAFASFGAMETEARKKPSLVPAWISTLRDLRNVLAHNHYLCFRHVTETAKAQEQMKKW